MDPPLPARCDRDPLGGCCVEWGPRRGQSGVDMRTAAAAAFVAFVVAGRSCR